MIGERWAVRRGELIGVGACRVCGNKPKLSTPSGSLVGWEHMCSDERVGFVRHTSPDAARDTLFVASKLKLPIPQESNRY